MRDHYEGSPAYATWLAGEPIDYAAAYGSWHALVRPVVARGVDFRRARVVSEPVSRYVRFEHHVTPHANVAAGERVRWLPRGRASKVRLPGNDFWLVDDVVLFSLFSGDGARVGTVVGDAEALSLTVESFEAVWALGIDHAEYHPD
ncbi:DUF6879 family protein [Krasilnikovia cinnamomea]|nr:DUF6879 family protein [Krasilnikovia cinnamomea]